MKQTVYLTDLDLSGGNIKLTLTDTVSKSVNWIEMTQDRVQRSYRKCVNS